MTIINVSQSKINGQWPTNQQWHSHRKDSKMKTIIDLEKYGDSRFKNWAKILTSVDTSKSNGYCFEGEFIQMGRKHELEIGSFILIYTESGSRNYHSPCVQLYKVNNDSNLEHLYSKNCPSMNGWALEVRDNIAKIVNEQNVPSPLEQFSNNEILAEARRRGLIN